MNQDGFQREVLAELGLVVYALAGTPAAPVQADGQEMTESAGGTAHPLLLRALLRAAAADAARTDVLMLCRDFLAAHPQPDAQARRALWPQLRRLRRQPPA